MAGIFFAIIYNVKKLCLTLSVSLSLIALLSISINAVELTDFKVNDDNTVTTQSDPKIAVAANGSFIITWVDRRSGTNDIFLQQFDTAGVAIGVNRRINDDTNESYQFEPAVACDVNGRYSVVWKDYRNGSYPFDPDIYFQRYNSSIEPQGINCNLTVEYPDSTKETPDIALYAWGGGVVVWADYRNRQWDVYGQLISSDGSLVGGNFKINDDIGTFQQHAPKVSVSQNGWFIVVWYDNRLGNDDIYAQKFDSLATPLGGNFRVNTDDADARQAFPDVATDGAGAFTVVWVDWQNGNYPSNPDIYSRKYFEDLTPITGEVNINTDNSNTAQREPSIASDRLGNVAIIWADSITNSWDISGQMIDVDGIVREANFKANEHTDSAQVSPDVALDGRYRYLTWVDRRNGNYDIYASVQQYNDPALTVSPKLLQFEMQAGTGLPPAQQVYVEHIGYNPLDFTTSVSADWLTVTPSSSTTADSISISINTDTLSAGVYIGLVAFTDQTYFDSSTVLQVRLDVYTPTMSLSNDTLYFTLFEQITEPSEKSVTIQNDWLGDFSWTASESADWLSFSSYNGTAWDTISVLATAHNLLAGSYTTEAIFTSAEADGSPDTLIVVAEVINDQPFLQVEPDSVFLFTDSLDTVLSCLAISNPGTGILSWHAFSDAFWLNLTSTSGVGDDTLCFTVSPSLSPGTYETTIEMYDSASFNQHISVPVTVLYYRQSDDSIEVASANVEVNNSISISMTANLSQDIKTLTVPLQYDTAYLVVDSVQPGITVPEGVSMVSQIQADGIIYVQYSCDNSSACMLVGEYHIAEIFCTAKTVVGETFIDTLFGGQYPLEVTTSDDTKYIPSFTSGTVTVSMVTAVIDDPLTILPSQVSLHQNYPNPFNAGTTILFELPRAAEVNLSIFNILGQRVRTMHNGLLEAGSHTVYWDGYFDNGLNSSSGLYFYKLETPEISLVRKMVLIK